MITNILSIFVAVINKKEIIKNILVFLSKIDIRFVYKFLNYDILSNVAIRLVV